MGRLAVLIGSNAFAPDGGDAIATAEAAGAHVLQRHRGTRYRLPHEIDHEANVRALLESGCDRALAICSVGSLDEALPVGSFLCPDDFIALQLAVTALDDESAHATPGFAVEWRREVVAAWDRRAPGPLRDGGVYWQTNGPRFETPAEVRLLAAHADVVGMTLASECVVAGELGLAYAAVCVVDNLANGVGPAPLSTAELEAHRAANAARLRDALAEVLPELTR